MIVNKTQRSVLSKLLDKYEQSKTYKNTAKINQSFRIMPDDIFPAYTNGFTDVELIKQFERDIDELKQNQLINVKYEDFSIKYLELNKDNVSQCYKLINRNELTNIIEEQLIFYRSHLDEHKIIVAYCDKQIQKLLNWKVPKESLQDIQIIFSFLKYILSNKTPILCRELSIEMGCSTKDFENRYKTKICNILKSSGEFDYLIELLRSDECNNDNYINNAILEEFCVYTNPSYIYLKGNATIIYKDGYTMSCLESYPIAISSDQLYLIDSITVEDSDIMTIENLASYNRLQLKNTFCIFLSGYHNSAKQQFLVKIATQNKSKQWFHFGDLDPDGFMIYENLKNKTGIPFELYKMNIEYLKRYQKYTLELKSNNRIKAHSLLDKNLHCDILKYMIEHNCKLEQEIISWKEPVNNSAIE